MLDSKIAQLFLGGVLIRPKTCIMIDVVAAVYIIFCK